MSTPWPAAEHPAGPAPGRGAEPCTGKRSGTHPAGSTQESGEPAFLFNTLNMISCMARLEDASTTDQMIVHLGSLFRHNLRTKRQQITLEEELDGLEDYIYLQQMRFDGRITVEKSIRVQPAAVLVPSFILQPVVEMHTLTGSSPARKAGASCCGHGWQGSVLVLTVADNGRGMTAEELDTLQARIAQSEQTGRSIGLATFPAASVLYPAAKCRYTAAQAAAQWCGLRSHRRSGRKKGRENLREVQIAGAEDD